MKLVIIGGTAAGMSAAIEAKRVNPDLSVTVYEATGHVNQSPCGLPYLISGALTDPTALAPRGPEDYRAEGLNVLARHLVTEVDYPARQVRVRDLATGRTFSDGFDQLLLATGAKVILPELDGGELSGMFGLRNIDDAEAILQALAHGARRVVVVGGGYIGLMMADALTKRGLKVT
ncbi:MAG TPA: FAD-dependent oxidoreductase, partial [Deinococcales bacterium]|nr:FAD-dependent oxidoreductase [Deinococcales bacterium]